MDYSKLKLRWVSESIKRKQISRELISRLRKKGIPVFERFTVKKVVLFGSVLKGRCREHSDMDILVMPLAADRYWAFRHELELAIDVPLDV